MIEDMTKRIDFYKTYYENISPTNFDVAINNDKIEISGFNKDYPKKFSAKDVKQYPVTQNKIVKQKKMQVNSNINTQDIPKEFLLELEAGGFVGDVGIKYNPYDFSGYDFNKQQNEEQGVSYLLYGEYPLVSRAIFEKDFSMWLFYNYTNFLNISFDDCMEWLKQAQESFETPIPIYFTSNPYAKDGRSYAMWFQTSQKPQLTENRMLLAGNVSYEYNGQYYYNEINLVPNSTRTAREKMKWGDYFQERKTGLLVPYFEGESFHFNTLMHEFAHCLDMQLQLLKNIEKFEKRNIKPQDNNESYSYSTNENGLEINDKKLNTKEDELEHQIYGSLLSKNKNSVTAPITNHFDEFIDALIQVLRKASDGNIPFTQYLEQKGVDTQIILSGYYGDRLLAQREKKRKVSKQIKKDKEDLKNIRFSWNETFAKDVFNFIEANTKDKNLLQKLKGKKGSRFKNLNLLEILEIDNLIDKYIKTDFQNIFMFKYPKKVKSMHEKLILQKKEANRIINNHYDNIRNEFEYGYKPENNDQKKFFDLCSINDFKFYKDWKNCAKTTLPTL